jgi:hypothetical protein
MILSIDGDYLRVERNNHPDDIYLYFNGGYAVWSYKDGVEFFILFRGAFFTLNTERFLSAAIAQMALNEWLSEVARVNPV